MKIKRKEFGSLLQLICFSSSSYILTEFLRSISQAAKRRIAVICLIIDSRSLSGVIRVKSMIRREKKNSSHKKWIILIFVSFFFSQDAIYLWLNLWLHIPFIVYPAFTMAFCPIYWDFDPLFTVSFSFYLSCRRNKHQLLLNGITYIFQIGSTK